MRATSVSEGAFDSWVPHLRSAMREGRTQHIAAQAAEFWHKEGGSAAALYRDIPIYWVAGDLDDFDPPERCDFDKTNVPLPGRECIIEGIGWRSDPPERIVLHMCCFGTQLRITGYAAEHANPTRWIAADAWGIIDAAQNLITIATPWAMTDVEMNCASYLAREHVGVALGVIAALREGRLQVDQGNVIR